MVKPTLCALFLVAAVAAHPAGGSELMLLDFWSPACGPCMQMMPTVASLESAGYPVRRIDVTRDQQLAQQFGVTQIPCFIMLADGQETDRIVGATSREQLERMIQSAMGRMRAQSPSQPPMTAPTNVASAASSSSSNDPWSGVGAGASDRSSQPVTRTAPLGQSAPSTDAAANELISSSVRLRVDDATGHSYGTGTIIDSRSGEALVITCGHLFRESKGEGQITVELFAATPEGVRVVGQVPGQVIEYNLDRDIGLVSIRTNGPVRVAKVAPADFVVERGHRVTSVGCDHGKDPTALATRVTNVDRYQGPPNIEAGGAPVEGRSGGGLFNADGQLIGVCFAADYEGNEGLYTALESIHDELDRLGLSDIYRSAGSVAATGSGSALQASQPATATPPVVRGQEPLDPVMPMRDHDATPSAFAVNPVASSAAPAGLNPVEQAAWDEIMARSAEAEVVCIIRPREPGGKSEVITLDRVSPQFVRALAERNAAVPATLTR